VRSQSEPSMRHLSSFHLEAVRLGVATEEDRLRVETHLATCVGCSTLANTLEGYRREFAGGPVPEVRPREPRRAAPRWSWRFWAAGVLMPLAVTGLLLFAGHTGTAPGEDPVVLAKGTPILGIVARRGERIFPVPAGGRLRPGDQIRFVIKRMPYPYALIGSVDGVGRPNIYVPYEGKESAAVTPSDEVELAGSIVLDGRLGPERFFALYSRKPLSADAVRQALQGIGGQGQAAIRETLVLPVAAAAQSSVLLEKVAE
jgi:hypothetical protein